MTKWAYLIESDAKLRELEIVWKASNTPEDAKAYAAAAKRARKLDATYYRAVWASGDRPSNNEITTRSIHLSDAIDQVVINYSRKYDVSITVAALRLSPGYLHTNYAAFSSRLHIAIGNPSKLDLDHMSWIIQFTEEMLVKLKKLGTLRHIRGLEIALKRFKELAGQYK